MGETGILDNLLRKHFAATFSTALLAGGAIAASALYFTGNIPSAWIPWQLPRQLQTAASAPPQQPRPSPLAIDMPDGKCVEPEQRRIWAIRPGDTALGIAYAIEDETTPPANYLAYELLKLNGVDERLLQAGRPFITHNAGLLMPKILLPSESIVLEEGQPFTLNVGLEGLLCGTDINAYGLPPGAKFDTKAYTLEWTPGILQAGKYEITFVAKDPQILLYQAVELRVQGTARWLTTDGENPVKYHVIPDGSGMHYAMYLDRKEAGYLLDTTIRLNEIEVPSSLRQDTPKEAAYMRLINEAGIRRGVSWLVPETEELRALDHVRRTRTRPESPESIPTYNFGFHPPITDLAYPPGLASIGEKIVAEPYYPFPVPVMAVIPKG